MAFSASDQAADGDPLGRSLDLYRDLSVALSGRIALLKAGTGGDADCADSTGALAAHRRSLQTVLDAEASLVKRSRAGAEGAGGELDLEAARAEILARLARLGAAG